MIFALIPAAGSSSRMGRPKLALPLGERTILGHVVEVFRQAGIQQILVVVGPQTPELVALAQAAGAAVLSLTEPTADMRATIQQGLDWLEAHFHPCNLDDWLLVPADHPALNPAVIAQLLVAKERNPDCTIVVPTFQGQRGHPALLSWKHVAEIKNLPADQGLNVYLRQHAEATLELPVDYSDILRDLDTPEDYEQLQRAWRAGRRQPPGNFK
jgi:molybdenum cofactor cytidylyltransferase